MITQFSFCSFVVGLGWVEVSIVLPSPLLSCYPLPRMVVLCSVTLWLQRVPRMGQTCDIPRSCQCQQKRGRGDVSLAWNPLDRADSVFQFLGIHGLVFPWNSILWREEFLILKNTVCPSRFVNWLLDSLSPNTFTRLRGWRSKRSDCTSCVCWSLIQCLVLIQLL